MRRIVHHHQVHIYIACFNESSIIRQTFHFYKRQFGNPHFYLLDNHSTDDSTDIAKSFGATIIPWGSTTQKNNRQLAYLKNNVWKLHQRNIIPRWILVCDMDEWLQITPEQLRWEAARGTTILRVKGFQMVSTSVNSKLTDITLANIRHGYADAQYNKRLMFLTPAVNNINYLPGCHVCKPTGCICESHHIYKLGHFKFVGLDFLIHNYVSNYSRTVQDRTHNFSVHYSNNVCSITQKYYDACVKANLNVSEYTCFNTSINYRFLIFIPYCTFFKPYIHECLTSIQNQTCQTYTTIIVDDGNEDPEFIATLQKEFSFVLLTHTTRQGPAASKWSFLAHVQKGIENKTYTHSDIVLILDGDDYLQTVCALSIIHNRYLHTKCMATFGEAAGKFCHKSRQLCTQYSAFNFNVRDKWMYNHPRTFKALLVNQFQQSDFHQNDTHTWLTKCTDCPIVYTMFDYFGKENVQHIDVPLYYYREHNNNTYKIVSTDEKKRQLQGILSRPCIAPFREEIHIVMCCWKRVDNLTQQLENLNNQTVANRIVLHLVNNNADKQEVIQDKVNSQSQMKNNVLRIKLAHRNNLHYGFERFLYIRDNIVATGANYVIIIDDDQLFAKDWVESIYKKRKPQRYITWYGRWWTRTLPTSYWVDSAVSYTDCKQQLKRDVTQFHYGGTGGCILDINIFGRNSVLWNTPPPTADFTVFNIEDLWLSFIVSNKYGWTIERSFLPEEKNLNDVSEHSRQQALYLRLKEQKTKCLHYLIQKHSWVLK